MAQLAHPPGMPPCLEGVLNLGGDAVPVVRLERLFQLPVKPAGLYSVLIILKNASAGLLGILVDRVEEVVSVAESLLVPAASADLLNGCTEATFTARGRSVHLLSPARLLLEREREILAELRALSAERLRQWEAATS